MEEYKKPSLTADIFIFNEDDEFILIKRKNNPYKNYWALPGGFVDYGETVENAAIREAKEETNIDVELQQLINVYSDPERDSRGHTVTIAYLATGDLNQSKAGDDAEDIGIFKFNEVANIHLAFDHKNIIEDALELILKK